MRIDGLEEEVTYRSSPVPLILNSVLEHTDKASQLGSTLHLIALHAGLAFGRRSLMQVRLSENC